MPSLWSISRRRLLLGTAILSAALVGATPAATAEVSTEEARAIAKEAYVWGFPLVDSYRIQHSYFVDTSSPEYKGAWNEVHNTARVYTPDDKAIQTPNSDTPYSFVGADLRAEPLVLTVPEVDKGRYYSLQFIDMYTFNFAYVGSRATGNGAGSFLLAGPGWNGETPAGVKEVIRSETEFVFVLYRTQLFGPDDIDNVKKIQAGYRVETLSSFLGRPSPPAAPAVDFLKPIGADEQKTSLGFFNQLNFILQFCPAHPSETELRARFAKIGIEPGKAFDAAGLSPEVRNAIEKGMADAWVEFENYKKSDIDTGKVSSADGFGTRAFLDGRYLDRMASAALGIYGNSKDEAIYPAYFTDADGQPTAGGNRYTLRFGADQLPPVNSFWSLTLYELPASLLSANKLNRYLINSPMLPQLKKDADGSLTLYVQHESPGAENEANWLPTPSGPFFMIMRLYWPKPEALDGKWKAPPLERAQ
ncbi:cell envelope protein [Ensifer adhaerens]|nr:cell envelope protein [Ensifer adhaerens]